MRNNPNVPRGAKVIEQYQTMSGEITWTIYELNGKRYRVTDWKWDKPAELKREEMGENE